MDPTEVGADHSPSPLPNPLAPQAGREPASAALAPPLLAMMLAAHRVMVQEAARSVPLARLTTPQFRILNFLHDNPGASLSQVAAHLGVRLPTASVMLMKLSDGGLVDRSRDPASRRRMQLVLTETGRTTIEAIRAALTARLEGALGHLPPEEAAVLLRTVSALSGLFQAL